jgi:hypothetical protein
MRLYQVQTQKLQMQLRRYQQNNLFYQDPSLEINEDLTLRDTCVVVDQTSENGDQQHYAVQLDESTRRFNAPEPVHVLTVSQEEEESEEQSTVSVVTDFPRTKESEDIRKALRDPDVIVHRSGSDLRSISVRFWSASRSISSMPAWTSASLVQMKFQFLGVSSESTAFGLIPRRPR